MTTRDAVPALCPDMLERVKTLEATPAVAAALQVCEPNRYMEKLNPSIL